MNSHQIASRIKKRAKEIRDDKEQYIGLLQAIFLDAMFRYPYINLKAISPKDRELAMKLWAEVMGRLTRNYFEIREDGYDYSPLGLFSEINRTAGCYNSESPDKTPYDLLVRIWDDMADSDSINYALLGKSQNPVHVVTLDKRSDVERRIKCLANNLYELESRGFASKFFPGTITIFDHELKSAELIKVKDLIYVKSKQ